MAHDSIPQLFQASASKDPGAAAYMVKRDGQWIEVSWADAAQLVRRVSRALMALEVQPQEKVCILSGTRLEWVLLDFGIVSCGAVTVGIYPSNLPADCAYIFNHCDAEVVFVENQDQLAKILEVREQLSNLRHIVIIDGPGDPGQGVLGWEEFLTGADKVDDSALDQRAAAIQPDDLASLVYTSGTTGVPKGAMITHRNLCFTTESADAAIHHTPGYRTLLFLPLAHVFARLIVYVSVGKQVTVAFAEDITKVADNLREVRPHFIASVPRIFEKVYDKVVSGADQAGGLKKKIFDWSIGVGLQVSRLRQEGKPVPGFLSMKYGLAEKLVFSKIQAAMGGILEYAISGAAPLNRNIAEFFDACGITILEGIGMTENTSFTNVNRIGANKFGTCGQPGPGIEQRLAEDGEILFRGANVMKGYYKNSESTAETIDADGWLHTGDIGEIDDEGYLRVTDRKKDLIITAGGKNVAPQRIERVLRTSHYIAQVAAYGDKRKFISALITLDPDAMQEWASSHGREGTSMADLAQDPDVQALIQSEVEARNSELASFESVKKFYILPRDFTIEDGELTPTLKLRRKIVYEKFANELNSLY